MTQRRSAPAVSVRGLAKVYRQRSTAFGPPVLIQALAGVDVDIPAGTTLGVVGESGCGKSTLGRCLVSLERPTEGEIRVGGVAVERLRGGERRRFRRRAQYVFQDPFSSLDPRMRVGPQVAEPMRVHKLVSRRETRHATERLFDRVGLPSDSWERFPHEFSGGQRQRIVIARALAVDPDFLVADEPVSALDVSVQAQILNLVLDLKEELGLTMVFIAHDLSVVEFVSDRVAVMYLGRVVECGSRDAVFGRPAHPYTKALLASAPRSDPKDRQPSAPLPGDPPSPANPPKGCPFHPRCERAQGRCKTAHPPLLELAEGHTVRCIYPHKP